MTRRAQSMVVYDGPSLFNGVPIVAVLTGVWDPSTNSKTGPMVQLWVLHKGEPHGRTLETGQDQAVCGACPYAGNQGCYVTRMATAAIWKALPRMARVDPETAARVLAQSHRMEIAGGLRIGAYGDPAAIPLPVIQALVEPLRAQGASITGYTHAWHPKYRLPGQPAPAEELRRYAMASCHNREDVEQARAWGWRPYVVFQQPPEGVDPYTWATAEARRMGVAVCPAANERPEAVRLSCTRCGGCNGRKSSEDNRVGFGAIVHGPSSVIAKARRFQVEVNNG